MSKDKRQIIGAVWLNRTTYKPGQEDELAAAATPAQLAHLTAEGAITADFGGSKSEAKASAEVAAPESEASAPEEVETDEAPTPPEAPAKPKSKAPAKAVKPKSQGRKAR